MRLALAYFERGLVTKKKSFITLSPEWELFDLKFDPKEEVNVADKNYYQVPTLLISLR
jgi:hypothetical protein